MKHFGREFTELLYRSGYTQKSIGDKLGLSHVTVTRMKAQPSVDAALLEKICRIFKVPVNYFFDKDIVTDQAQTDFTNNERELRLLQSENKLLRTIVEEKERTIQILLKQ